MTDQLITGAAQRLDRRESVATSIRREIDVSFEFFPPTTPAGAAALEASAAQLAEFAPRFVSVTYGAGGSSQDRTFAALSRVLETGVPVAGHLTCVAASKHAIHDVIDVYRALGVTRIVALRGDRPADAVGREDDGTHPDGYRTAAELVAGIRSRSDGADFDISVAAYPEVHPKAASARADLDNLKSKIEAGADRAITQFFFDADVFLRFRDQALSVGIDAPIVPGIMPVTSFSGVRRFSDRCGTKVPEWMHELFDGLDDAPEIRDLVAATVAAEQCKRLAELGVNDFHFYTMNKPNLTAATCRILGLPGASSTPTQRVETRAS